MAWFRSERHGLRHASTIDGAIDTAAQAMEGTSRERAYSGGILRALTFFELVGQSIPSDCKRFEGLPDLFIRGRLGVAKAL
jgi:hypothetical protein